MMCVKITSTLHLKFYLYILTFLIRTRGKDRKKTGLKTKKNKRTLMIKMEEEAISSKEKEWSGKKVDKRMVKQERKKKESERGK